MPNPKKTEELTLKLIKSTAVQYLRPAEVVAEERFYQLVCRQTSDQREIQFLLLDKEGNPVYYQLQFFLDSDTDTLNDEQKQMLLQDPRYWDPATGRDKEIPIQAIVMCYQSAYRSRWQRMVES